METRYEKLPKRFFAREDVVQIAKELLGKLLVSKIDDVLTSGVIVETEAYRAPDDKASHAYGNRRTKRTEIMFAEGGLAYVYLCYGIHNMFNVVTGPKEMAHAVLIRALEPRQNLNQMIKRRSKDSGYGLTSGPGLVCQALGIQTYHTGADLVKGSTLWVEDQGLELNTEDILSSPRVGIDYADECASWPWRFRIKNNPWTSKAK